MSHIRKIIDSFRVGWRFVSRQNIEGTLLFDDEGFTFKGQVGQRFLEPIVSSNIMELEARDANIWVIELNENVTSFDFKHAIVGTYIIKFIQDDIGTRTVTFPANFKWGNGTAPDFSEQLANSVSIVSLFCDGINFYGTYVRNLI